MFKEKLNLKVSQNTIESEIDMQMNNLHTSTVEENNLLSDFKKKANLKSLSSKAANSLFFWSKTLYFMRTETSVIFAPIFGDSLSSIELIDVIEKILELKIIDDLQAINILPNKSFIYLDFHNSVAAAKFQNNVFNIKGKRLYYVMLGEMDNIISVLIDKIPLKILKDALPGLLEKYGEIVSFKPTLINIKGRKPIETTPIYFDFKLLDETAKQNFPYHINISGIKIYMLVKGRPNICYNCDSPDHVAAQCSLKFCAHCKRLKAPFHNCVSSYANTIKKNY